MSLLAPPAAPAGPPTAPVPMAAPMGAASSRIDYLDATRAFALLLGIVFHASLSFMPVFMGWAVMDVSTSPLVAAFVTVSHAFRMETFFLLAGYFGCITWRRQGTLAWIRTRAVRLLVPFVVGWFLLRPLLVSGWIMGSASLRGEVDLVAGLRGGYASLATLPQGIFTGSHLWFLYYLMVISALLLIALASLRSLWRRRGWIGRMETTIAWLAASRWTILLLALPTAGLLHFMQYWGVDTPDRSLRPHVPVLLLYGGCFALGWSFARRPGQIESFGRLSIERWAGALLGTAIVLALSPLQGDPAHPWYVGARTVHALAYAVMMWSLVSLTLGVFRAWIRRPQAGVRYVADASYWLYLMHLPVVVWLQVAVAELPAHWSFKLAGISLATLALGLLSYELLVRSTAIGLILNGRRHPRRWPWVRRRGAPGHRLGSR